MLKSRNTTGKITQEYHTYYITSITKIEENPYYYIVYGDIISTINRNAYEESKKTYKVKILKYFEGWIGFLVIFIKNIDNYLHVYPSGLRERSAKPLFAGSNPATCSMPR